MGTIITRKIVRIYLKTRLLDPNPLHYASSNNSVLLPLDHKHDHDHEKCTKGNNELTLCITLHLKGGLSDSKLLHNVSSNLSVLLPLDHEHDHDHEKCTEGKQA